VILVQGQRIAFGHASLSYRVDNVDSPRFRLRSLSDDRIICPTNTLVGLPSDDEPLLTVCLGASGWAVEEGSNVRQLSDQEVIQFGQERWQVELPPITDDVAETGTQREQPFVDAKELALDLRVSPDREQIVVTATVNGRSFNLPNRAHHELLLLLVEARLAAKEQGISDDEAGYMTLDEAIRSTAVGINKIHLDIFRLRREFEGIGLRDARQVIERRDTRREFRVGTGHLSVQYERSVGQ
jgi:hypothetical protein